MPSKRKPKIMQFMSYGDVKKALRATKTVILPTGGMEAHGYHLPLAVDTIVPYEFAVRASERTGCMVATPIPYSWAGRPYVGTTDITPDLTQQLVFQIGDSLLLQGFRNLIVLIGHGGHENVVATKQAARELLKKHSRCKVAVTGTWQLSHAWEEQIRQGDDSHAGEAETSVMLYMRPELVGEDRPSDLPQLRDRKHRRRQDPLRPLLGDPDLNKRITEFILKPPQPEKHHGFKPPANRQYSVEGYPDRATLKLGEKITQECVATLAKLVRRMEGRAGSR